MRDICEELSGRGHEITVLCPYPGHQTSRKQREAAVEGFLTSGVRIGLIHAGRTLWGNRERSTFGDSGILETLGRRPWDALPLAGTIAAMRALLQTEAPKHDMLLSHWLFPSGWLCAGAAMRIGIPHLCIEHGGGARLTSAVPGLGTLLARRTAGLSQVQFVSTDSRRKVLGGMPESAARAIEARSFVFPVPAPLPEFQQGSPDRREDLRPSLSPLRILVVGRLVRGKGHPVLLDALEAIEVPFQTILVGDGPERERLERQTDAHGLSPHVNWVGEVSPSRLPTLYRSSHVLVVPSLATSRPSQLLRGEGTPRVLLEAMSHGCVPVASRVGGIPDVVDHGVNGLLFSPGDAGALAELLGRVSSDPALLPRLRANARHTAHRYGFRELWSRWREALQVAI